MVCALAYPDVLGDHRSLNTPFLVTSPLPTIQTIVVRIVSYMDESSEPATLWSIVKVLFQRYENATFALKYYDTPHFVSYHCDALLLETQEQYGRM
jgi:hypothetical protein